MTRYSVRKVVSAITRKWIWLFVFAVFFAVLISSFYWYKIYSSHSVSATFFPTTQTAGDASSDLSKTSLAASSSLLKNEAIIAAVSKSLDFEASASALSDAISIEAADTAAVTVKITWGDAAGAAAIMEAYKANLSYAIAHTANAGTIKWMDALSVDSAPVQSGGMQAYIVFIIGAFAGLVLGAGFAYFMSTVDKRVFDMDKVCYGTDVLVIGTAGRDKSMRSVQANPAHRNIADRRDKQLLATALYLNKLMECQGGKMLMCVSPTKKCGVSTIVKKTAQILSGIHMKILIVSLKEKNMREAVQPQQPVITQLSPGIDECTCVWDPSESNCSFIGELSSLLSFAMNQYSLILVDCPPLLENVELSLFAGGMDAVLLICRYGQTKYAEVAAATQLLFRADAKPVYCMWNFVTNSSGKKQFTFEPAYERKVPYAQPKSIGADVHL
jgi:capsular polysaccharide biosynthesis protein